MGEKSTGGVWSISHGGGDCYRPAVIAVMGCCGDPAKIGQTEEINE